MKKQVRGACLVAVGLCLLFVAPASSAWKESATGNDWWYVDPSYGDYHSSAPLTIEINGDPSSGQEFYVGETVTMTCDLYAVAQSCSGDGNGAYTEWLFEVAGPSGPNSITGSNYDSSSACALADVDTTLSITYELTALGTHTVYMSSYAAVAQYWTDIAEESAEALLTFEVVPPVVPMASFVIDRAKLDFKKKANDDKVHVRGRLEVDFVGGDDVAISEDVIVTVGPLSQTITMVEKGKKGDKWEYKGPKHGEGFITRMTIDWKNGRFDIHMHRVDLTGVTNPVSISIQIGDDSGSTIILLREKKHHWDWKAP